MSSIFNLMNSISNGRLSKNSSKDAIRQLWEDSFTGPLEDFLGRKGKRIRADLIDVTFRIGGGTGAVPDQIVQFVELLHAGSLIIDDIQDNSRNRRQKEAMHLKYGVPIAINTGNWLYFAAIELLTELDLPAVQLNRIMKKSLHVIKRCHEGQALDLGATFNQLAPHAIPETVQLISNLKTGALTSLAAWLGGVMSGADESICDELSEFGMSLGVGLQMQNDFVELQKAAFSRHNSDDFRNRRVTWPWAWLASSHSGVEVSRLAEDAMRQLPNIQNCAQQILERIDIFAVNEINQKLEGSAKVLDGLDVEDSVREKLDSIVATLELHYV
ncbi:MAG: polyprenyl synthetase family protein [Planctomycetota bacterium]